MESESVFKWVGLNYVLQPLFMIIAYGLILRKKTRLMSAIIIISTLVNIPLNLNWIPPLYGVIGSVWATLVSYGLMGLLQIIMCPKGLRTTFGIKTLMTPVLLILVLAGIVIGTDMFGLTSPLVRLVVMGLLTLVIFIVPAWFLDAGLRRGIRSFLDSSREVPKEMPPLSNGDVQFW